VRRSRTRSLTVDVGDFAGWVAKPSSFAVLAALEARFSRQQDSPAPAARGRRARSAPRHRRGARTWAPVSSASRSATGASESGRVMALPAVRGGFGQMTFAPRRRRFSNRRQRRADPRVVGDWPSRAARLKSTRTSHEATVDGDIRPEAVSRQTRTSSTSDWSNPTRCRTSSRPLTSVPSITAVSPPSTIEQNGLPMMSVETIGSRCRPGCRPSGR